MRAIRAAAAAALLFAPAALAAQTGPSDTRPDCAIAPSPPSGDNGETLAEVLEPCDGVLKPPKVGDAEMAIPAPPTGRTPVIRPEALPEQQVQDPK